MRYLFIILLLPLFGISQTFEKIISESYFQCPQDLIETTAGYLLLSSAGISDDEDYSSKLYIIDRQGDIIKSKLFDNYYYDRITNVLMLDDTTFLLAGYFKENQEDSINLIFRLINNNLNILSEKIVKTTVYKTEATNFLAMQSDFIKFDDEIVYAYGYHSVEDKSMRGLYLVKMSRFIDNIKVKHFQQLSLPGYSLPECLLPNQSKDSLFVFFPYKAYKLDKDLNLSDSLLYDFFLFPVDNSTYGIYRPFQAYWVDDKLIAGGNYNIFRYNKDLSKDTLLHFEFTGHNINAAYYKCMSINQDYLYMSFSFDLGYGFWHGVENKLRILKTDKDFNVCFDKIYNENDGFYYASFNTLATKDGGCIIATTRNNINTQGEKVDIYLLKVDSLGNYDTTDAIITNKINEIQVFPNPGDNYFRIELSIDLLGSELILYNISGMVVNRKQITSLKEKCNTTNLNSGLYIYEIRKQGKVLDRGKWIKK